MYFLIKYDLEIENIGTEISGDNDYLHSQQIRPTGLRFILNSTIYYHYYYYQHHRHNNPSKKLVSRK